MLGLFPWTYSFKQKSRCVCLSNKDCWIPQQDGTNQNWRYNKAAAAVTNWNVTTFEHKPFLTEAFRCWAEWQDAAGTGHLLFFQGQVEHGPLLEKD